jgi:hypothetical protein
MKPKSVRRLEKKLEDAIAEVIVVDLGPKHLPLLPNRYTMQMMAKAATAVYEAAVANCRPREG